MPRRRRGLLFSLIPETSAAGCPEKQKGGNPLPALPALPALPPVLPVLSLRGDVDLDRPRLGFLTQREPHGEDAVLVLGRDPVRVDGLRQRERAAERPVAPLGAVELLFLHVGRDLLFALDRQDEVLDVAVDVVA